MKKIITILVCFWCLSMAAQQKVLTGHVENERNEAITNTEIQILDADENYLQSVATDSLGKFDISLDTSSLILHIDDHLHEPFTQQISVENQTEPIRIQLKLTDEQLSELTILVKRPKIKQKIDRLIFDVENSTLSNLNTWEILKRTPNITVRNGNLQVRNNNSVLVTINDKKWLMSVQELQTLLENTPGEELESIEVITNPPAQYEASGAAIVNIKLKQNKLLGYKGMLGSQLEQSIYAKALFGTTFFYNTKKWNFAASYYRGMGNYVRKSNDYIFYEEDKTTWKTITNRKDTSNSQNTWNAIVGYQKDSLSSFTFGMNGFYQPNSHGLYNIPTTITNANNEVLSQFYTLNLHNDFTNQLNFYGQYDQKIYNHKISAMAQLTNNATQKFQDISTFKESRKNQFTNDEESTTRVLSLQADDSYKKDKISWDNGLKFSTVSSTFQMDYADDTSGSLAPNPSKSNAFTYDEQNYAAYTTFAYDLENWAFKAGLRAEYTYLEGIANNPHDLNNQSYLQWFPSLYAQRTFKDTHQLGISYDKRISRPFYAWLNPTKSYYNEFAFFQGDPRLRATLTHNIEINYSFKNAVITPYFRYEKNPAMEINFQIPENKTLMYKYTNIKDEKSFGLQIFKNFELSPKVSVDISANTEYRQKWFWGLNKDVYLNKHLSFNGRANAQIQLQETSNWTLNASYFYTTPSIQGTFTISGFSNTSLQTTRTFLDKKLNVSLAFNDIFFTEKMKISTKYDNQDNYFIDTRETQKVALSLRYSFGNQTVKALQKAEKTDEQNRL